jgi:hypothetical protein
MKKKIKVGDRVTFTVYPKAKGVKPYLAVGVAKEVGKFNFGANGIQQGVKIQVRTKKFLQTHTQKSIVKMIKSVTTK